MNGACLRVLAAVCACACALCAEPVRVAFPAEGQRLPPAAETYVIGAVAPGRTETLYVNGEETAVYRTGAFLRMVAVAPGTNTLVVRCGRDRCVRTFVVEPPRAARGGEAWKPIADDDDPRLGAPGAWKTVGTLFANRVRADVDDGESLFFLPKGFVLRGAEVAGRDWIAVWLENRRGYLPRRTAVRLDGAEPPPRGLIAPDSAKGFPDRPPYGRAPATVRICVDAGHGGADPGACSPHGWREKDVNLMQARAIRDALEKAGFQVMMTRDGDSFPPLLSRPAAAYDARVDAFISVHHNATVCSRDPRLARHTTAYASLSNGLALAACIQKHVGAVLAPVPNAGAQLKSLAVCRNPAVPSCLLEIDFINLPEGEEASWDPLRQKRVADAVVCGVLDWMMP